MHDFNIERLEGKGILAKVIDDGQVYSTYSRFAVAAGHPDAVEQSGNFVMSLSNLEGQTVTVLARGDHESRYEDKLYVCQLLSGEKFIIGFGGLELLSPIKTPLSTYTDEELIEYMETLGYMVTKGTAPTFDYRKVIVERAKKDVSSLLERGRTLSQQGGYIGNHTYQNHFYTVDFVVNMGKRTVVALIKHGLLERGPVKRRGIAKCDPEDCFNEYIGKAIALRRALGLDVPDDYLNAPAPVGKEEGDIVSWTSGAYELIDKSVPTTVKTAHVNSYVGRHGKVINDTARYK